MNDWHTKDRSETSANRMPDRALGSIDISNPALGINVYSNVFSEADGARYIETLESSLNDNDEFFWGGAKVTQSEEATLSARNAQDFKIAKNSHGERNSRNAELYDLHEEIFRKLQKCMDDYGRYWGVGIQKYEAFNFVKYDGAGTHFKIHADHGPTYVATVSAVIYLNDDYEGGELYFPRFGLELTPKPGDIAIFPSTFIYEHASQEMFSGVKYSVVVMTDYNDRDGVNQKVSQTIKSYELKY